MLATGFPPADTTAGAPLITGRGVQIGRPITARAETKGSRGEYSQFPERRDVASSSYVEDSSDLYHRSDSTGSRILNEDRRIRLTMSSSSQNRSSSRSAIALQKVASVGREVGRSIQRKWRWFKQQL